MMIIFENFFKTFLFHLIAVLEFLRLSLFRKLLEMSKFGLPTAK